MKDKKFDKKFNKMLIKEFKAKKILLK